MNRNKQLEAIDQAEQILTHLRSLAQNDRNRKYILFRANELEQQIVLEKEEYATISENDRIRSMNQLVNAFNQETAKPRPDFSTLWKIHSNMTSINSDKAKEIKWLIDDRVMNINHELTFVLDNALLGDVYKNVEEELIYLQRNNSFLKIPPDKVSHISQYIEKKQKADALRASLLPQIAQANKEIHEFHIKKAWNRLISLRKNLKSIHPYTDTKEFSQLKTSIKSSWRRLVIVEDSLVRENVALIKKGDSEGAVDYCSNVLRAFGVKQNKIALVEKVILEMPQPENKELNRKINQEVASISTPPNTKSSLSYKSLMQRVHDKRDSIHSQQKKLLARNQNQRKLKENQKKAQFFTRKLYSYLENREIEKAYIRFEKIKRPLKKYSPYEVFTQLEAAIYKSYEHYKRLKNNEMLISLNWDTYENRETEQRRIQNQERAKEYTRHLYDLLEQVEVQKAYDTFYAHKKPLKKYSHSLVYRELERAIGLSYNSMILERMQNALTLK